MTLSINLIITAVFSLIAVGYLLGFFSSFFSCRKHVSNVKNLSLDTIREYSKIISSLTGKIFYMQDSIENLTDECLNQKEKIDDLTLQISDMKIIRTKQESGNLLTDNFFKNSSFFAENNHDVFMKCVNEILVDTFISYVKITDSVNKRYMARMNDNSIYHLETPEKLIYFVKNSYDLKQSLKASKN